MGEEDVEVKKKAACSLFSEQNPSTPMRRFFCNFSFRRWKEKLVSNTPKTSIYKTTAAPNGGCGGILYCV